MRRHFLVLLLALPGCTRPSPSAPTVEAAPRFDATGALVAPADYRSWPYLTTGFAMAYGPAALASSAGGVQVLDNVFVDPDSYDAFRASGHWPEGTMFALEIRTAEETGSIVQHGDFQTDLVGFEATVKDSARFPTGWGYFAFPTDGAAPQGSVHETPGAGVCHTCHVANGAVDSTFTQFYPTMFAIARAKATVRADFVGLPASGSDLGVAIAHGGWDAAAHLLDDVATAWPNATVIREGGLNAIAYRLLGTGQVRDAIAAFAYVAARYPSSANAWDSLSEAYEQTGDSARARDAVVHGLDALAADTTMSEDRRAALRASLEARAARLQ
jgi:hypothetical protein